MPLYTLSIVFHGARSLPIGDLHTLSIDPFIHAELHVPTQPRARDDSPLSFRTPTLRQTRDPDWNAEWIVSGIPSEGFILKMKIKDEDPSTRDDSAGHATADFRKAGVITDDFAISESKFDIKKRRASPQVYIQTYIASILPKVSSVHGGHVILSIRVVGKAPDQNHKSAYTVGPTKWTQHFSPLIGSLTSSRHGKSAQTDALGHTSGSGADVSASTFVANKIQLTGPVPPSLRHRFVGYRPFMNWMFGDSGFVGHILYYSLRKQYRTIYSYDANTKYGVVETSREHQDEEQGTVQEGEGSKSTDADPAFSRALALQFLNMTSFGTAGRLFTYAITLDGEWRFTETGEEFAVQMLSKHSMHADLAKEIAFSGEFFVRPVVDEPGGGFESARKVEDGSLLKEAREKEQKKQQEEQQGGDDKDKKDGGGGGSGDPDKPTSDADKEIVAGHADARTRTLAGVDDFEIVQEPGRFELVIDNSSGTYRPPPTHLPALRAWLAAPACLGALGRVTCVDGFDPVLKQAKLARSAARKQKKGVKDGERVAMPRSGSSVSSIGAGVLGRGHRSLSSGEVKKALREQSQGEEGQGEQGKDAQKSTSGEIQQDEQKDAPAEANGHAHPDGQPEGASAAQEAD